jgi:hypothetical protein
MPIRNHDPSSKGMTARDQSIVNRLHYLADGPLDPVVRPIIADGLALILELIADRGKQHDFDKQWDRPHGYD